MSGTEQGEWGVEATTSHSRVLQVAKEHWSTAADMPAYCATSNESLEQFVKFLWEQQSLTSVTSSAYVPVLLYA
jgi:hypothetical protein